MKRVGSSRVAVSQADIRHFTSSWPASGLVGLRGVTFEYDRGGNLVDITYKNGDSDRWDGPALLALSHDAQRYLEAGGTSVKRRRPGEHATACPHCKLKHTHHNMCGHR